MPGILHEPLDRRRFLQHAVRTFAGLGVAAEIHWLGFGAATDQTIHLALLSDTHIPADPKNDYRRFLPVQNLKTTVGQVLAARPEAVVLNGDVARLSGQVGDYEAVKRLLAPLAAKAPIYIGLGNHDDRINFFKVMDNAAPQRQQVASRQVLVLEWPALRIIVLDSLLYVNKVAGYLGKPQREWLGRFLEASDQRATVLFVHHTLGDAEGDLLDVDKLFRLVQPHRKVKAIFYGHSHEYRFGVENGMHLVNIPAVGYNFADSEPVGWIDAKFAPQGVELVLHAIGGNRARDGQSTVLEWKG